MIPPSTERWKRNRSVACAWKYHTEILELQRDVWKRNRSVVCAWKDHTEILELQRDAWKRNRSVVCAWRPSTYNTSISLPHISL
jgi:hypothetical protein